jgi:uncharacterized membrane protein YfcA
VAGGDVGAAAHPGGGRSVHIGTRSPARHGRPVGAGAIGVTALYFLYPKLPAKTIVGSDIVHAVPLTLIAGSGYWSLGAVDWSMLASLLVGSIPGIISGSASAPRIPDRVLRPILAGVLTLVGAKLVLSY